MLVFVGTGVVVFGNGLDGLGHLGIAFAFGLAIVVAAYSIGTVSGAHLNPAVSIAMFVTNVCHLQSLSTTSLVRLLELSLRQLRYSSSWLTQACQLLVLVKMLGKRCHCLWWLSYFEVDSQLFVVLSWLS